MATPNQVKDQLGRLRTTLLKAGLQQTNQPLFQVINSLIDAVFAAINTADAQISGGGGGGGLANQPYLTSSNALAQLPSSRQLIAGDNVAFDDSIFGERTVDVPLDQEFLTGADESATLPNSRQLLAGTGITFDDTVPGERTISSSGGVHPEWSVLTTGDVDNPELVFAGGQVIMLHTP